MCLLTLLLLVVRLRVLMFVNVFVVFCCCRSVLLVV